MIEVDSGHIYLLDNLKGEGYSELRFHKDAEIHGMGQAGPSTQEVLRACIARVKHLHREQPHPVNDEIISHLRSAIIGFERRALERKLAKSTVEQINVGPDGHIFSLNNKDEL